MLKRPKREDVPSPIRANGLKTCSLYVFAGQLQARARVRGRPRHHQWPAHGRRPRVLGVHVNVRGRLQVRCVNGVVGEMKSWIRTNALFVRA